MEHTSWWLKAWSVWVQDNLSSLTGRPSSMNPNMCHYSSRLIDPSTIHPCLVGKNGTYLTSNYLKSGLSQWKYIGGGGEQLFIIVWCRVVISCWIRVAKVDVGGSMPTKIRFSSRAIPLMYPSKLFFKGPSPHSEVFNGIALSCNSFWLYLSHALYFN